jgi:hypothetical protein
MLKVCQVVVSFQVGVLRNVLPFVPVTNHPAHNLRNDPFRPFDDQFKSLLIPIKHLLNELAVRNRMFPVKLHWL